MYIYLFLACLIMVFFKDLFSGGRRNSRDPSPSPRDGPSSGRGITSRQRDMCEVSDHDHFFPSSSTPSCPSATSASKKNRSVGNEPSMSKARALSTHTAEEPVHALTRASANIHLATPLQGLRSADTADLDTPGNLLFIAILPSPMAHRSHRDAVQQGHAAPCIECRKQPQAIGELCLGCNSTSVKSNEPRLKELDLRDPKADSRAFRDPAIQSFPTDFCLSCLSLLPSVARFRDRQYRKNIRDSSPT